jgi:tRNA(fMet)-specific endonuclease VapC
MRYMLDTDISSYLIKGGYGKAERHIRKVSASDLCISAVTRAELIYGLKLLSPIHRLHTTVHHYLKTIVMLPWDAEAANFHAEIKFQLKTAGTPIGEMDMLIAAHAIAEDAVLVTNNTRHFKRIKLPLMLANWME